MAILTALDPLIEQLSQVEGKAEIVNGEIVEIMPTGGKPSYAALIIAAALLHYTQENGGIAFGDNAGFLCDLPHRKSFSPDAAFYVGPEPDMGFLPHPPIFAVEVRSENDYGPKAERAIAAKIADYFAAGTLVVWDVDLENEDVVAKYSAPHAHHPQIFRRDELADAAPALENWKLPVDSLFRRPRD